MWMLRACINLQLLEHLTSELALWHHSLYCVDDDFFRLLSSHLCESGLSEAARITGVSLVDLVRFLPASSCLSGS